MLFQLIASSLALAQSAAGQLTQEPQRSVIRDDHALQAELERQIVKSFGTYPGNIIYVVPSGVTRAVFQEQSKFHDVKWTFEALQRTAEALDVDLISTSNASLFLPRKLAESGSYVHHRKDFYASISSSVSNLRVLSSGKGELGQLDPVLRRHLISAMFSESAAHYVSSTAVHVRAQFSVALINDQGQEVASIPILAAQQSSEQPRSAERPILEPAPPSEPHFNFGNPRVMSLLDFKGVMGKFASLRPMRIDERILGTRLMVKGRITAADAEALIRNLSTVSLPVELRPKSQFHPNKLAMMKTLSAALKESGPSELRDAVRRIESQPVWTLSELDVFLPHLRSYVAPEQFGSQKFRVRLDPAIVCTHPGVGLAIVFKP